VVYILENLFPIFLAALGSFVFGAVYFGVLAKPWMSAAGITRGGAKAKGRAGSAAPMIWGFLAEFWIASILAGALILSPPEAGPWAMAIGTAFILWIGFVFPSMLVNHRYEGRPWRLTLINGAHWLGVLVVQAVVLQSVGVEGPGT
jgi:hypothetical protein